MYFLPGDNIKCDLRSAVWRGFGTACFSENSGGSVDTRKLKNKRICQQIPCARTLSSCGNDGASSKPHNDSGNRNLDMLSESNRGLLKNLLSR